VTVFYIIKITWWEISFYKYVRKQQWLTYHCTGWNYSNLLPSLRLFPCQVLTSNLRLLSWLCTKISHYFTLQLKILQCVFKNPSEADCLVLLFFSHSCVTYIHTILSLISPRLSEYFYFQILLTVLDSDFISSILCLTILQKYHL
jgi:hypothetical protein